MPVLVQSLASRFRGGVKIVEIVKVKNSGGCIEIRVALTPQSAHRLSQESCMFVKMCVPSISLVWHPFTVFKHPDHSDSARFLVRPVGKFTKTLASNLFMKPSPIVILDGMYRGGDRINEAFCHDVATIVCGGVAIAPFLSMIPAVLQTARHQGPGKLKKLILHWSCREEGLFTFVSQNYLTSFSNIATGIGLSDFELQIVVYHTGNEAKIKATASNSAEVTDYDDAVLEHTNREDSETPSEGTENDKVVPTVSQMVERGHSMELSRFMPAVHSSMVSNIPQFLLMGGSLWVGFILMHHFYYHYEFKVLENLTYVWSTIVWVFASIALAICFEVGFLSAKKYVQATKPEAYEITYNDPEARSDFIELDHRYGRPHASDIFSALQNSHSPGIFMCGPPGLTDIVKKTAAMENAPIGIRRYALYEETFEM